MQSSCARPALARLIKLAGVSCLACATGATTAVQAQDGGSAVEEIVVHGWPTVERATAEIQRTPGAVEVIPDTTFKSSPVQHVKDILGYAPGVITQVRMGDDARVSVRGSGLSRAYGTRGIALYLDGIPLHSSDGLVDFFEIDPSAYRYVEVYKGANALRYGANALGGAVNLVTPVGSDASAFEGRIDVGSFGYAKTQASTGGATGAFDYFATLSTQRIDGYREHSEGRATRANLNVGYELAPEAETRFYLNAVTTEQRIPGEVTKAQALNSPRSANPAWITQDQQRNVDSLRIANKTAFRLDDTTVEVAAFYNQRQVDHPIYQYLDYSVDDYGGSVRAVHEHTLAGMRNRLIVGANIHNGTIDTEQFINLPGAVKGDLAASMADKSKNFSLYAEESLFVRPDLALIAGVQYLRARRQRQDRFHSNGDQSGRSSHDLWSPRIGVLWDARSDLQVFANISRSAEVPSYDADIFARATSDLRVQRATTYEIGTRGGSDAIGWDLSFYRAVIRDELQCLTTAPWSPCAIINADRTVHQGIEAGFDAAIPLPVFTADASLSLSAAYSYNDFYFDGDAVHGNNRLPGVPQHFLRAELLYRNSHGFHAGPNVEWAAGDYYADNANSLSVDPYALLNFRIGFDAGTRWSIYVEGRNLSDRRYISTIAAAGVADAASEIFNPGTGRALHGGVRFNW